MLRRKSKADQTGCGSTELATEHLHELIARRAYELYELRGSGPGDELTDWLMAEQEILAVVTGLKAAAIDRIGIADAVGESKSPGKGARSVSNGSPRKKTSATAPRSTGKPKGVHP